MESLASLLDLTDRFMHHGGADAWFDRREAERYEVQEQSVQVGPDTILTILNFVDGDMLEEADFLGRWRGPRGT